MSIHKSPLLCGLFGVLIAFGFPGRLFSMPASSHSTVVFQESGFPAFDTSAPSRAELENLLPRSIFVNAEELPQALADPATQLFVLPYGSAYPEADWDAIYAYLQRGGNLLVLGGRPFSRAAYWDAAGWHLREYSVRATIPLRIDQYQQTPGSPGLSFKTNPDVVTKLSPFDWNAAFSPILHLTDSDVYNRQGSSGRIDSRLDTLAWGTRDGRRMAAPAIQIDHVRDDFAGGRWIFLCSKLADSFYTGEEAKKTVPVLAATALRGSEEFIVAPVLPLYLPGEPVEVEVRWIGRTKSDLPLKAKITVTSENSPGDTSTQTVSVPAIMPVVFPAPAAKGFHTIEAELYEGQELRAVYRSAFWTRDEDYLRSGPRLSVGHNYFQLDGHPLAVVGTTYMSSEVQRLYFDHPNVYVWNRDMAQIHSAGLNMLRTGWWTGWDKVCDEEGRPYERTLRTLEAYLMTARRNGLPVQFNFFAFLPDVLGGENSYLDPQALRRQKNLVTMVAARFHEVPFVAWDLINEPSFSQHTWQMRPNGDSFELKAWNTWLNGRYPDRAVLADDWNFPTIASGDTLPVPREEEFTPRGMYSGFNSLKLYDFYLFAQETFANWVKNLEEAIRATGSRQLITVGQDEGGYVDRLSPAFFSPYISFSANHSWWVNDGLLWDSLVAKQPGLPMLIQETGLQRELTLDEIARRTQEAEGSLFERKVALSFIQGSGAIEWLWNSNDYMTEGNEVPIGALRADGTEKPVATVLRNFAKFSQEASGYLSAPQPPPVTIVTSQAAQFSAMQDLQIEAQRKAVRALCYGARVSGGILAENLIEKLGSPKLVILPSPQALADSTWQALLAYVNAGGNALITGPVEKDTHWHPAARAASVKLDGEAKALTAHTAQMQVNGEAIPLTFDQQAQSWLEELRLPGDDSFASLSYGKGRIYWAGYPVELAQGTAPAIALYKGVLALSGVAPKFELKSSVSPGVLIYPTELKDAVLYAIESESDRDQTIDLRDKATGGELKFTLAAQHAALAVLRKPDGAIVARYGF
ncbi:MAG TPA: hypothetical protein VMJ93_11480 [Verrucomicrobiae bacterium]|nr:hypothetical protein [Verrucomicrobiae bacterium]